MIENLIYKNLIHLNINVAFITLGNRQLEHQLSIILGLDTLFKEYFYLENN